MEVPKVGRLRCHSRLPTSTPPVIVRCADDLLSTAAAICIASVNAWPRLSNGRGGDDEIERHMRVQVHGRTSTFAPRDKLKLSSGLKK